MRRAVLLGLCALLQHVWLSHAARIGAVFRHGTDEHLIAAFKCAVDWAQANVMRQDVQLNWDVQLVAGGDVNAAVRSGHYHNRPIYSLDYGLHTIDHRDTSLHSAIHKVCQLLEHQNAIAIFGPSDHAISRQLEAITAHLDVPYVKVVDDHHPLYEQGTSTTNLHPARQVLEALKDLVNFWNWKRLILVYKEERRIIQLASLFEADDFKDVQLSLIKIDGDDFLGAAKRMEKHEECEMHLLSVHQQARHCPPGGFSRVMLDLSPPDANDFLTAALKVGLIQLKHWYLLTSLDLLQMDMEMFRHNHARFIGLSVFDNRTGASPDLRCVQHARRSWFQTHPDSKYFPQTETMLMIDAVVLVARSYKQLAGTYAFGNAGSAAKCALGGMPSQKLPNGQQLVKAIHQQQHRGLSGLAMFDKGERTNVSFNINLLGFQGTFDRIGYWESATPDMVNVSLSKDSEAQLRNNLVVTNELKPHMRVTTIEERPYVMLKRNHYQHKGNEKFEGFCIDLLERLAKDLGFSYTLHIVKDGAYGALNNGTWDGMIGEIINDQADMAVAPLTVTYIRAESVDFTKPFLSLGISILYRIPDDHKPNMFSFLNPLSKEIWLWIVVAAVSVTMSMFVIARLTPFEWNPTVSYDYDRPPPRGLINNAATAVIKTADKGPLIELTNNYSFFNTLWYVTSTLLKGGCDFGPRAVSTRLLGGVWWVFTLIITSAYTANLAAVLTVDKRYIPIKSLEDLANQTRIVYGAVDGGSTSTFFKESKIPTHMRMWRKMSEWQEEGVKVMTKGNRDGVDRVLRFNYAYLMESASLEYEVQQNCNLTQVGGVLGSKGYGIALAKHSKWTDMISRKILDYAERGIIELIKTKWWRSKGGTCTGTASTLKENRLSLNMENVSGLFVVLLGGLMLAVCCVVIEFCMRSKQNADIDKTSIWAEMATELRFALRLHDPTLTSRRSASSLRQPTALVSNDRLNNHGVTDSLLKQSQSNNNNIVGKQGAADSWMRGGAPMRPQVIGGGANIQRRKNRERRLSADV